MAWVGDMLVAGLAGAITSEGHKAAEAATDMAKDTLDAVSELSSGIDVPININDTDLHLPNVDLGLKDKLCVFYPGFSLW